MIHNGPRDTIIKRRRIARDTECTAFKSTSCPSGNLRQFVRGQGSHPTPVKLAERRESDVVHIKVQPHPDGIRGHQIVDLAILIHGDLRVACARAERAHNHRRAPLLAPDQLCNRIYILNRKPDDRTAWTHTTYLFLTRIDQFGHSLAPDELRLWHQRRD